MCQIQEWKCRTCGADTCPPIRIPCTEECTHPKPDSDPWKADECGPCRSESTRTLEQTEYDFYKRLAQDECTYTSYYNTKVSTKEMTKIEADEQVRIRKNAIALEVAKFDEAKMQSKRQRHANISGLAADSSSEEYKQAFRMCRSSWFTEHWRADRSARAATRDAASARERETRLARSLAENKGGEHDRNEPAKIMRGKTELDMPGTIGKHIHPRKRTAQKRVLENDDELLPKKKVRG